MQAGNETVLWAENAEELCWQGILCLGALGLSGVVVASTGFLVWQRYQSLLQHESTSGPK